MNNLTIYLIRHGETDLNKAGIVQGKHTDTSLNSIGYLQADCFYETYRHISFDRIYTSTLKRTQQTVEKFIQAGIPWLPHAGLDELSWGVYDGKKHVDEVQDLIESWKQGDLSRKFEQGENPLELKERQLLALTDIVQNRADKNILICMHGRAMRVFLCLLLDRPLSEMESFHHTNTGLYILRSNGKDYQILDANNTAHLNHKKFKDYA